MEMRRKADLGQSPGVFQNSSLAEEKEQLKETEKVPRGR